MGVKRLSLEKMKPSHETPTEVLELVRMSVLETLQADFYHSEEKHVKSAVDLHIEVANKYPNFYVDVFSDPEFIDYFLDAHKILSLPHILQDKENIDVALSSLINIQPDRLKDAFGICRMKNRFGVHVSKTTLRKLFEILALHIENEKGVDYVGYMGVKYASGLKDIMATIRAKRNKLSPIWREVMTWAFTRDVNAKYSSKCIQEASTLRKAIKTPEEDRLFAQPEKLPFTVWQGYAKALGVTEKEIFKAYHLMTKNEVRRNLATLQKHGILESIYHAKKIKEKVMKVETDLIQLFYGLKVLDSEANAILMEKGKQEFATCVASLKPMLEAKKISIAIDCSGGCMGHSNLLDPDMQKRIAMGKSVPKWAKIVIRESFHANVLIGKVLADTSKQATIYTFNEVVLETNLPESFESMVEELKEAHCGGGSNILDAVENVITDQPDIAFIITDMNENIPFQGALKTKLEELAKRFSGQLVFVVTETVLERADAVNLDDLIRDKRLSNVFIMPINKLKQLIKGFTLLELLEKAKERFIKIEVKKKKKVSV